MATTREWAPGEPALQAILEARRRQLADQLQRRIARIREIGTNPPPADDLDRGDQDELDTRLIEITAAMLRRVDQAIARLGDGRYGWCTRCHGPIGEARLRAMPFAVHCHECEARRERDARSLMSRRQRLWSDGYAGGAEET